MIPSQVDQNESWLPWLGNWTVALFTANSSTFLFLLNFTWELIDSINLSIIFRSEGSQELSPSVSQSLTVIFKTENHCLVLDNSQLQNPTTTVQHVQIYFEDYLNKNL